MTWADILLVKDGWMDGNRQFIESSSEDTLEKDAVLLLVKNGWTSRTVHLHLHIIPAAVCGGETLLNDYRSLARISVIGVADSHNLPRTLPSTFKDRTSFLSHALCPSEDLCSCSRC